MRCLLLLIACSSADSITRRALDPAGPCLQLVHPRRRVWQLYRDGKLLGPDGFEQYEIAMLDHPPSLRRLRRSVGREWAAVISGVIGVPLGVILTGVGAALKDQTASVALAGVGLGGFSFPTLVTTGILAGLSDQDHGDAVADYNRRGCRP